ncbi:hypothetical protein BOA8489_01494 [Boseongicola aestuarii]|uniref:Amino acid synthesis n=1 Tax=Boseongicola aestuarii TaxID=1470561 RepID=A0A238IYA1_9RHOB|nr:hypothetical protein BOA8489_01494 [Boseongicola aestuarii]
MEGRALENPRKIFVFKDITTSDAMGQPCDPVTRVAVAAIIANPCAGRFQQDLAILFETGGALGKRLADEALEQLRNPAVAYGKAAIVGINGDIEHGGAVIHPKLGAPMRNAVGGGDAVIPSNVKIGGPGTAIDLPLGHKDNPWSFDHFDTMTLTIPDGPRPDEIVMFVAYSDGARPIPRCGKGPVKS